MSSIKFNDLPDDIINIITQMKKTKKALIPIVETEKSYYFRDHLCTYNSEDLKLLINFNKFHSISGNGIIRFIK